MNALLYGAIVSFATIKLSLVMCYFIYQISHPIVAIANRRKRR